MYVTICPDVCRIQASDGLLSRLTSLLNLSFEIANKHECTYVCMYV
jgi:hypothetical protein